MRFFLNTVGAIALVICYGYFVQVRRIIVEAPGVPTRTYWRLVLCGQTASFEPDYDCFWQYTNFRWFGFEEVSGGSGAKSKSTYF
jgi:hypothetical protein